MKGTKSSLRYATALLELAIEKNVVEDVSNDIHHLHSICENNNDIVAFLNSPIINSEKKVAILQEVFSSFNEISTKFIQLITKNKRENILPSIAFSFVKLMQKHNGIVPVKITVPSAIKEETKTRIISKLPQGNGITYDVSIDIDKDLIGGFIIRMEDKQLDASIRGRINDLKLAFNAN